jgi:hypothetical protein
VRPLTAIIALLTGVAPGLVEGVTAPITPIGLAYFLMRRELAAIGLPEDLVQILPAPITKDSTEALMKA